MSKHGFWVKSGKAVVAVHREEVSVVGLEPAKRASIRFVAPTFHGDGSLGDRASYRTKQGFPGLTGGKSIRPHLMTVAFRSRRRAKPAAEANYSQRQLAL